MLDRLTELPPTPHAPPPFLPGAVRLHLGRLLGAACTPPAADPFDEVLARLEAALAAARTQDEATFRADLLAYAPRLLRFARSLARDGNAAEDVAQEALLRAWRARSGFRPGTNFEAWLFTITRNAFLSSVRRNGREVCDGDDAHAERMATVPAQDGRLDLGDVRSALARLPPPLRDALLLVAVENVSYEAAAGRLGCQIGTVKSRVWRARDRLSKLLGYSGAEIGADGLTLAAMVSSGRRAVPPA